jgi:endonuclease-8
MGRLGPDLCRSDTDLGQVVNLLLAFPDADEILAEVMLDQRVMCGVGNVYRSEVLWATELSPFARVGDLGEHDAIRLANTAATQLRANLRRAGRVTAPGSRTGLAVYARTGQRCARCGGTIESRRVGRHQRTLYWCPGCQVQLAPVEATAVDDTPMDPHPAAAKFLSELPWRRNVS